MSHVPHRRTAPPEVSTALAYTRSHPDFVRAVADLQALGLLTEGYDSQPTAKSNVPSFGTQPAKSAMDPGSGLLRATRESTTEHIRSALLLEHPLSGLSTAEPTELLNAAKHEMLPALLSRLRRSSTHGIGTETYSSESLDRSCTCPSTSSTS